MFSFIYRLYYFKFKPDFLYPYYNRLIVLISNYFFPIYFKTVTSKKYNLNKNTGNENINFVVSLTTFPARVNKVWLTVESILRQSDKPDKILLWLYKGEFNGKQSLPQNLLKLEKRGLDIRFCDDNLMPHKKYYYTMQLFPDANVITIDDDFFFPRDLLKKIKAFHLEYPKAIICPIARKINISNSTIQPYNKWDYCRDNSEPTNNILTMGGGGTLFPPNSLHEEAFNKDALIELALSVDDLWLKIMSIKNETKVVSIAGEFPRFFIPVKIKKDKRLMDANIMEGNNDKIFSLLIKYYKIPIDSFTE